MALNTSSLLVAGLMVPALVCAMPVEASAVAELPTVSVSGKGTVSVKPDRATVSVGAWHQAETAIEAQSRVNEIIEEATKEIRKVKAEGMLIQTSGLSLSPVYNYQRDKEPKIIGYRASIMLTVRIDDIDKTGAVIDAAMETGVNQMHGVSFSLKDDSGARRDALKKAVQDGRQKAEAIADALGRPIQDLLEVSEQGVSVPIINRGIESYRTMAADSAATPIEAGEIEISASVNISYSLGQ
ncbi:MAG: SIMPL domain-containing protein [Phycisphaerales bacterium JB065]